MKRRFKLRMWCHAFSDSLKQRSPVSFLPFFLSRFFISYWTNSPLLSHTTPACLLLKRIKRLVIKTPLSLRSVLNKWRREWLKFYRIWTLKERKQRNSAPSLTISSTSIRLNHPHTIQLHLPQPLLLPFLLLSLRQFCLQLVYRFF